MSLPSRLRPSQLAPLIGKSVRTVHRMVEHNDFPEGSFVRHGRDKIRPRIAFLTQRLLDCGWLTEAQVAS